MSDLTNTEPPGISRTSIFVAAGRALGAREPDPAARNPDYLAEKLLGDPSTLGLHHPAGRALSLTALLSPLGNPNMKEKMEV